MNSNSGRGKLEGFFSGKGFYIVLFLCAAVIGGSAWMMASGNQKMAEDVTRMNRESLNRQRVETVILPPQTEEEMQETMAEADTELPQEETVQVWKEENSGQEPAEATVAEAEEPIWLWPVLGELERSHDLERLHYDVTLRDWRTHEGVDILAPLGETVCAAHSGVVRDVRDDALYGTVVTVDHGDGTSALYANLAAMPAVETGDWVNTGDVIGAVGTTALCEIGQGTHLHFAMYLDGQGVDPLDYLPA